MSLANAEVLSSVLLLPESIAIEAVYPSKTQLTVQIVCVRQSAACPLCQQSSERIHSRYGRTVADVPCGGRRVILALTVRKFVCHTPTCPRKLFTERLPDLVQSYARMTNRLSEHLQILGLATCGQLGERLAPKLGMKVSGPTLLRRMKTVSLPPVARVRVLGIDDWAWKKGQTYGTILVDLERRRTIDLLPDRATETVVAWLRAHPEVEIVSRDRGSEYAAAAKKGAPQAQQIADRFHLLLNLREKLKELMARKQKHLPEIEAAASDAIPDKVRGGLPVLAPAQPEEGTRSFRRMSPRLRATASCSCAGEAKEAPSQVSRSNRYARYQAVQILHEQALSEREIARRLKLSRKTVHRFLVAESFPERSRPPYRGSILDPYKPYILERWKAGCWNGTQLLHEVKRRGYTGSESLFRLFIVNLRKQHQEAATSTVLALDVSEAHVTVAADLPPKPSPKRRMSPSRASWLCVSQPCKLDEKQRQQVEEIRAAHPDLESAYRLCQAFVSMLKERRDEDLDQWLAQAKGSGIAELKSFAQGIGRDYDAVRAAFSSEWSQGQVEAQVNCLKLQKRIMFGRANFDFLRLRVLCRV